MSKLVLIGGCIMIGAGVGGVSFIVVQLLHHYF
jgi:hypothetical protein